MNTSKFYKKLTQAEVGQTKTHEVYIRMPNDFDYESFFNNTHVENGSVIEVNFSAPTTSYKTDTPTTESYDYRFVFFANSNKEKRIPGLGPLFSSFDIVEGDVVCIERIENGETTKFSVAFYRADQIQISPASVLISATDEFSASEVKTLPLDEPLQVIYYGAPGTGKSHLINNHDAVTDNNTIRTTFHPDSDYSTFVGAYKPTMDDVPVNAIVGTNLHRAKHPSGEDASEKKIVYKYVPQAFLKAYVEAWSDLDNPHFLVIEEINRGNCAQIFGDLFQLLDRNNQGCSTYAIHADDDIAKFLAEQFGNLPEVQQTEINDYKLVKEKSTELIGPAILSGKKLLLPHNLYIWATMNTSDQSLFPIDSAFKRRWDWVYIPINYEAKNWRIKVAGHQYLWSDFLKKINPEILELTMSADKQMGFFFAKPDEKTSTELEENNLISERVFLNKVLFYLWSDVLKDFEPNNDIFRDPETGKTYQFDKFFTDKNKLAEFVGKLGLKEVGAELEELRDKEEKDEDEDKPEFEKGTLPTFSVNDSHPLNMIDTVTCVLTEYLKDNPKSTTEEVLSVWNSIGLPKHALETPEQFNDRTDATKKRASNEYRAPDGRLFYVSTQLRRNHMDNLIIFASAHKINVKRLS